MSAKRRLTKAQIEAQGGVPLDQAVRDLKRIVREHPGISLRDATPLMRDLWGEGVVRKAPWEQRPEEQP